MDYLFDGTIGVFYERIKFLKKRERLNISVAFLYIISLIITNVLHVGSNIPITL